MELGTEVYFGYVTTTKRTTFIEDREMHLKAPEEI